MPLIHKLENLDIEANMGETLFGYDEGFGKVPKQQPSEDDAALVDLNERMAQIRDRVRGVALRHRTGFYLHGRAGTSKTHTVRSTLETLGVDHVYSAGHVTPLGLYELLNERPDGIFVLDDVGELFRDRVARQILLAALGKQGTSKVREVTYRRVNRPPLVIPFTGGVIAISNLELHTGPVADALKSRLDNLRFNPTDSEIAALLRGLAKVGWPVHGEERLVQPADCAEVTEFVIEQSRKIGCRLDMRTVLDKGLPDFLQYRNGQTETHWKDLILSTLHGTVEMAKYAPKHLSKKEKMEADKNVLREIFSRGGARKRMAEEFKKRTGWAESTFFRRLGKIRGEDDGEAAAVP